MITINLEGDEEIIRTYVNEVNAGRRVITVTTYGSVEHTAYGYNYRLELDATQTKATESPQGIDLVIRLQGSRI